MELEAEEQNKTPIIKLWKEVGAELAVKLAPPTSFLFSFYKYSWIASSVPHAMLGTHTSMNELLSLMHSYQVIKIHHMK